MDDERVIEIETKLSHQEDLLSALNEALSKQQVQIAGLEGLCRSLLERIRALSNAGTEAAQHDDVPPHY